MTTKDVIVCDSCGNTTEVGKAKGMWFQVRSVIASKVLMEQLQEKYLAAGESMDNLLDAGDFDSLECLSNWASTQANFRSLDIELGDA